MSPRAGNRAWYSTEIKAEREVISISLEKPLGMILEEVEEGGAKGVYVAALNEEGSAFKSDVKDLMVGMALKSVMGTIVSDMKFDGKFRQYNLEFEIRSYIGFTNLSPIEVMAAIIVSPSPVNFELEPMPKEEASQMYPIGTVVPITVVEGDKETILEVKVGDNLRLSLLENGFEVYRGFKSKIGNCGGGGQCTFCAVDFISGEGWTERSEYEDSKLKRSPLARLSCLTNVQGPAAIRLN
jgi:ferredoxin